MLFDFLMKAFRKNKALVGRPTHAPGEELFERAEDSAMLNPFPEPVIIEFRDVLDLHSIPPRQIRAVVEDYLQEAHSRGVKWVRIIHGRGKGVQRERIRSLLSRTPHVLDFRDAPPEAGGWGATLVTLAQAGEPDAKNK